MSQKTVSIVTAYFNRKPQFLYTLKTISITKYDKSLIDIIVVDDASDKEHILDEKELSKTFGLNIKVIRITKEEKSWKNPVIPYNVGFHYAKGDIIIYQNPECCYKGDIISYTVKNLGVDDYFSYTCIALNSFDVNEKLYLTNSITNNDFTYYNHIQHRPKYFHFCSAIHKSKMDIINGFNEYMKDGYWYDDDEILLRIKLLCKMSIVPMDEVFVIHQFHPSFLKPEDFSRLRKVNANIMEKIKSISKLLPNWRDNKI